MKIKPKIKLFIAGGTIDKTYDKRTGMLAFKETQLLKMLARSNTMAKITPEVLFLKDSLDVDDDDRKCILERCLSNSEKHILISHGTDTMVKTAQLLGAHINNKTVVLFGAMAPYAVNHSDALFNLGFAMSAVQTQGFGVYIAMNGQIFDFNDVKKNQDLSIFEKLND